MLFGEILAVALGAIRANKLRSFLTALGIVIGVAAVITMVAIGSGAQKAVQDQISALGTNLLSVFPGQAMMGGFAQGDRVNMKVDDAMALAREGRTFANVLPELQRNMQVKYGNKNGNIRIIGATSNYPTVKNFKIEYGRMFTTGEDDSRKRIAVLGSGVPLTFATNSAAMIGTDIDIGGVTYEVVGVLASKGASGGFQNQDEQILIPLWTARYRAFGTDRINSITIQVGNPDSVNMAMLEIERILRREHAIPPGSENDFQIRNQAEFLSAFQQTTATFTYLLAGIAAVSLIVGGIGIMNIMLVSVTERTREIGVRKALGATRANIMLQFLIEAVVLCVLGGAIGVLLGSGGAVALARLFRWNTLVSPSAIVLAFVFSATVGIIFGLWPARRAAKLDPIVALRYE